MMKNTIIFLIIIINFCSCKEIDKNFKEGDIIFHESQSRSQGEELRLAT